MLVRRVINTKVRCQLLAGLSALAVVFMCSHARAQEITSEISNFGETTHLEFSGRSAWNYEYGLTQSGGKKTLEMNIDPLSAKSIRVLKSFTSPLIEKIEYTEQGPSQKPRIKLVFKNQNVEVFDYQTESPSRYVVDFFYPDGVLAPTDSKLKAQTQVPKPARDSAEEARGDKASIEITAIEPKGKSINKSEKNKANIAIKTSTKASRAPALSDAISQVVDGPIPAKEKKTLGLFDGGDPNYERFGVTENEINEDAIILSKENYFIEFPILKYVPAYYEALEKNKPIYDISPNLSRENKEARLVLKLHERGRSASFLKTLEWFRKKYPESEYLETLAFLEADTYAQFWEETKSEDDYLKASDLYKAILEKYPNSLLYERTSLLVAVMAERHGDYTTALRLFHNHLNSENPRVQKDSKDLAQLGLGSALIRLKRYGEAYRYFEDLSQAEKPKRVHLEAKSRKGDVFFEQGEFLRASEEYQKVINENPDQLKELPNVHFNRGESLFRIEKFKDSLSAFVEHLKIFPNHPFSSYAMTRVAEILETLGVKDTKVVGALLETAFRFGDAPSTIVARLRLLTRKMKKMKPLDLSKSLSDLRKLKAQSQLKDIDQFYNVMISDGYQNRGEYTTAVNLLTDYLKKNPSTADKQLLTNRIIKNINLEIGEAIEKGDFIKALEHESAYADSWLKTSKRLDTRYFVGQAFELAGVPDRAREYYQNLFNSLQAIKGTADEKKVKVTQSLPTNDTLMLRLAATSMAVGKDKEALESLRAIQFPQNLSISEQVERILMISRLYQKQGEMEEAIVYLSDVLNEWKSRPQDVAPLYLELAKLEESKGEPEKSLRSLQLIEDIWRDSKHGFDSDVMLAALKLKIKILDKDEERKEKVETIVKLLDLFEEKKPLGSYRYQLGLLHFADGDLKKAENYWANFKGPETGIWKKLASEKMKGAEWRDQYKKYLKRIPAMADPEGVKQ